MFYCNTCAETNNWPESMFKSVGSCEVCGKHVECNDRPSSSLPRPKRNPQTKTDLKLTISISEMKELIEKMEEEHISDNSTSEQVVVSLCEDSDKRTLVIDRTERVHNLSSYQECNGAYFRLEQY